MKNLKTAILSVSLVICSVTNLIAQEAARGKTKGKVTMAGRPGSIVVFGGGTSMPSSDGKDNAFLSNATAFNADVFLQLKRWTPIVPKPHISIGLNIGGAYNFGGKSGFGTTPNPIAVTGQTSSVVADKGTDPAQAGFRMGAGPQVNFQFGKLIISPMVLGEYFSMTQKEMSIVQTTQYNGQSYEFTLSSMPKTKTSGFAVTPKLRLHYMFNHRFGLFADASYTMGPKIKTTVSKLVPLGAPDPNGNYELQALQFGSTIKGETQKTSFKALGLNVGIVIGLGKTPQDDGKGQQTHKTKGRQPTSQEADKQIGSIRNGGTPSIDSLGNTIYIMNFSSGCQRACSEQWVPGGEGWVCPGEQTNISCIGIILQTDGNLTARVSQPNQVYDENGDPIKNSSGICTVCGKEWEKNSDHPNCTGSTISNDIDDIKKGWNGIILSNAVCLLKDSYGNCNNGGVLCISSTKALDDIGSDELLTNAQITKENSKITVTSTEIVSKISAESLAKFKNKSITNAAIEFPKAELETLFETINLKLPKGANQFAANEVSYSVSDDNVIKIKQLKTIVIENSTYEFEIVTLILNRTKMSLEKLDEMNGTKSTNSNNPAQKQWVECNGGLQWDCHYDAGGNIVSNPNGRACAGNWSTY